MFVELQQTKEKPLKTRIVAVTALMFLRAAATAQDAPAECHDSAPLPAALTGWTSKDTLAAATDAAGLGKSGLTLGRAATVSLDPTGEVRYVLQPDKPGDSVAHGGLLGLTIAEAGAYQVSLNSGAWIDMVKDGATLAPSAHHQGPACTGIHKTLQFPLQTGAYVVQISGNLDPTIQIMVSKAP
jgi:hypothetical protein